MRNKSKFCCLIAAFTFFVHAQNVEAQRTAESCVEIPLDGIYSKNMSERVPLAYPHLEQRDVLWEKRIWREIDVKELRNHHFVSPNKYFINILLDGLQKKKIKAYSAENENFTKEQNYEDISKMIIKIDTVPVVDPVTEAVTMVPVKNDFNPASVIKYRINEIVYFDSKLGRMNTRIIGIAPIVNITDSEDNLVASTVLCWFHYNSIRPLLAKEAMLSDLTDIQGFSWDDVFQSRFFSSYITKESNVKDARLQDLYSGMAILHESEKIKENIRNIEADFFSEH